MDLRKLAKEYLTLVKAVQLATSSNDQLWICTVYFVADEEFNLYWTSGRSRQHSTEILQNPNTAATVVRDTERKQAIQMTGKAQEVSDEDLDRVHNLYTAKYGPKDYDLEDMKKHDSEGRSYWVFKPSRMLFWDEVNFPEAPKQEILLS